MSVDGLSQTGSTAGYHGPSNSHPSKPQSSFTLTPEEVRESRATEFARHVRGGMNLLNRPPQVAADKQSVAEAASKLTKACDAPSEHGFMEAEKRTPQLVKLRDGCHALITPSEGREKVRIALITSDAHRGFVEELIAQTPAHFPHVKIYVPGGVRAADDEARWLCDASKTLVDACTEKAEQTRTVDLGSGCHATLTLQTDGRYQVKFSGPAYRAQFLNEVMKVRNDLFEQPQASLRRGWASRVATALVQTMQAKFHPKPRPTRQGWDAWTPSKDMVAAIRRFKHGMHMGETFRGNFKALGEFLDRRDDTSCIKTDLYDLNFETAVEVGKASPIGPQCKALACRQDGKWTIHMVGIHGYEAHGKYFVQYSNDLIDWCNRHDGKSPVQLEMHWIAAPQDGVRPTTRDEAETAVVMRFRELKDQLAGGFGLHASPEASRTGSNSLLGTGSETSNTVMLDAGNGRKKTTSADAISVSSVGFGDLPQSLRLPGSVHSDTEGTGGPLTEMPSAFDSQRAHGRQPTLPGMIHPQGKGSGEYKATQLKTVSESAVSPLDTSLTGRSTAPANAVAKHADPEDQDEVGHESGNVTWHKLGNDFYMYSAEV